MKDNVNRILVPVNPDEKHFAIARQAAEFASRQQASLHLIHIAEKPFTWGRLFNTPSHHDWVYRKSREKIQVLSKWQSILSAEYGIRVFIDLDWGNPVQLVLQFAYSLQVAIIITSQEQATKKSTRHSLATELVTKFKGQVILLRNSNTTIADWRTVVIPVTDFIPEKRIRTIIDIARIFHLKIHLISATNEAVSRSQPEFYFLTETLKRFKSSGNISVECRCLPIAQNKIGSYLAYSRSIDADVLMSYLPTKKHSNWHRPTAYFSHRNPMVQYS